MTRVAAIALVECDVDGGINLLVGAGIEVTLPASFIMANGLLSDDDADWSTDSETLADLLASILERKGFEFDRGRLGRIVEKLVVPSGAYFFDPADFSIELSR